jgi:DNA-binding transcriptional regulator LsrR (DeoR family)
VVRSARLQDRFGLQDSIVVDTSDGHAESLRQRLGRAAAELLSGPCTFASLGGAARSHKGPQ